MAVAEPGFAKGEHRMRAYYGFRSGAPVG